MKMRIKEKQCSGFGRRRHAPVKKVRRSGVRRTADPPTIADEHFAERYEVYPDNVERKMGVVAVKKNKRRKVLIEKEKIRKKKTKRGGGGGNGEKSGGRVSAPKANRSKPKAEPRNIFSP